jgi:hypothetical protein
MNLPRVRFTIQRLMIAVAIAGLILGIAIGGVRLLRRHGQFQGLAEMHAKIAGIWREEEQSWSRVVALCEVMMRGEGDGGFFGFGPRKDSYRAKAVHYRAAVAKAVLKVSYRDAMRSKYQRAARYPWLSVEPDPPEPE